MKEITIKLYTFEELSKEAKEKAIEKNRYINVDYGDWYHDDGLLELTTEEIKKSFIKTSNGWYKGNIKGEYPSYTGLFKWKTIYFDIDREHFIQFGDLEVIDDNIFRKFLKIPKKLWNNLSFYFYANPDYRFATTELMFESEKPSGKGFTKREQKIIDNAVNLMNSKIQEALASISKNYDWLVSDEAIAETLISNEYDFTEDGEIY